MNTSFFHRASALVGAAVICIGLTNLPPDAVSAQAEKAKMAAPQVMLAETYNAVTAVYFTNMAVHKGSHKPGLVERRFRADVKYWLMDARYYDQGELSIGNPPLVELVRELGSKNRPENAPTTLSAMAYEMARGVLERYPIIQKIEIRLVHFSKGLETKDETEDNHVVNLVLQR
jgi:hypothetical protein